MRTFIACLRAPTRAQCTRRQRSTRFAPLAMVLCCVLLPFAVGAQTTPAMRFGVLLKPDTVQVGDPFTMTVSVEVPAGAHVTWPTPADSNGPVALRAPVHVTGSENGAVRRETAEYALVAWAVGAVTVTLPDINVRIDNADTVIPFQAPSLFVETVLPADTSLRVPKPAKGLFPRVIPWWELWWPAVLVVLLLALLTWLVVRHRRRKRRAVELDPFVRAERDFQRLDRLALGEAGEQGRFVALALEVLRMYLSARISRATLALTSDELLSATATDARVPSERLAGLMHEGDAIKFGQLHLDASRARELALEARAITSAVEQAEQARLAAVKAEQRAQQKKSRALRNEAEEQARLASRRDKSEAA